jgi:hypothetical protein
MTHSAYFTPIAFTALKRTLQSPSALAEENDIATAQFVWSDTNQRVPNR